MTRNAIRMVPAAAVLAAGASFPATAQERFGDWRIDCAEACQLHQTLSAPESDQRVLGLAFVVDPARPDEATLIARVPLGTALVPGLQFEIGESVERYDFQVCDPESCIAAIPLEAGQIEAAVTEGAFVVATVAYGATRGVGIRVSTAGLAEGLASLRER